MSQDFCSYNLYDWLTLTKHGLISVQNYTKVTDAFILEFLLRSKYAIFISLAWLWCKNEGVNVSSHLLEYEIVPNRSPALKSQTFYFLCFFCFVFLLLIIVVLIQIKS